MAKTRRVEIPRLVRHPKYGKILRRKTVCHVHDETEEAGVGDTVEIANRAAAAARKRWELVRVVSKSRRSTLRPCKPPCATRPTFPHDRRFGCPCWLVQHCGGKGGPPARMK